MRKISLVIILCVAISSLFSQESFNYVIQGELNEDSYNGNVVYLYESILKYVDNKLESLDSVLDSTFVEDGKFLFNGSYKYDEIDREPLIHGIRIADTSINGFVILQEGRINFEYLQSKIRNYTITTGTSFNELLTTQFILPTITLETKMDSLMSAMSSGIGGFDELSTESQVKMGEELLPLITDMHERLNDFVRNNINQPFGEYVLLLLGIVPEEIENQIIHNLSQNTKGMYQKRKSELLEAKIQSKNIPELVQIGKPFVNFKAENIEGKELLLSDIVKEHELILLDFWASWCMPCLKEIPFVKQVYDQYNVKGLEIVGITLDMDKIAWQKAIEKNDMNWIQVIDSKQDNQTISDIYGVSSVPSTLLINGKGEILARDLRGNQLLKKIEELLQ